MTNLITRRPQAPPAIQLPPDLAAVLRPYISRQTLYVVAARTAMRGLGELHTNASDEAAKRVAHVNNLTRLMRAIGITSPELESQLEDSTAAFLSRSQGLLEEGAEAIYIEGIDAMRSVGGARGR